MPPDAQQMRTPDVSRLDQRSGYLMSVQAHINDPALRHRGTRREMWGSTNAQRQRAGEGGKIVGGSRRGEGIPRKCNETSTNQRTTSQRLNTGTGIVQAMDAKMQGKPDAACP